MALQNSSTEHQVHNPLNRAVVYTSDRGIVAVGPDRSVSARFVADIAPGDSVSRYVAQSSALRSFTAHGESQAESVASFGSVALDFLSPHLREHGHLDHALPVPDWTRLELPNIADANRFLEEFCQQFADRALAVMRFCLKDNTAFASAMNIEDEVTETN